jgi:hypothetical protein
VLFSDGQRYWLADGFHLVLAAREAGLSEFPADVRSGNERDALLYSVSCNAGHGLPRSNADKRKAVSLLLADPEWSNWSDGEIARHCQVSQVYVTRLRKRVSHNMPNDWHCVLWSSSHLRVHDRKPLGDGQDAKSMVGTNEFDRLTGFVEIDRNGQLEGIERSEVLGRTDSMNQPLGRLEVSGGQTDDSQSSRRHIAAKPSRQLLETRLVEFSDADLFGEHRMQLDN